jgi:hypothetical protein
MAAKFMVSVGFWTSSAALQVCKQDGTRFETEIRTNMSTGTLTTIHIPFIQDWDLTVRSESRDGGGYVFRVEGLH